jgi:acetyl-CoA synthetase
MSDKFEFGGDIVWKPTSEYLDQAHLTVFMRQNKISSFQTLLERSTADIRWFTQAVLDYLQIEFYNPYSDIVNLDNGPAWARWCVDGRLNIIHNCLDKYISTPAEHKPAFIWESEEGESGTVTYGELYRQVNQAANALRALGVGKGDVVGIFMPMIPEIVVALLAVAKIGGVILPLFSGYGAGAVAARLADAEAKLMISADGFFRRGNPVFMKPVADDAAAQAGTIQHILVVKRTDLKIPMNSVRDIWWHEFVNIQSEDAFTEQTVAEDILMLIYTSGTTGKPKGAVHTHCGFPIKAAQDMAFGTDVHPGDVIYWLTDMGWMMGPWLVFGALLLGSTFLIYDGAPDFPTPGRLWQIAEKHQVTTLGVSPTLIRSLIQHGDGYVKKYDLSHLRFFASTGEPWNPDPWMWLFDTVGEGRRPIINYSGGTEISGGIVMGNPILPLKPCAFSAPCPGIAADVYDESGNPVRGQVGELVIKAPWIGMTRGFWREPQRYIETYWSRWPRIWVHGDFAAVDQDGLWYILGRSDDTIKVAGKRLGPAEVESILVRHPMVIEAAAIGIPHEIKGNELVVFCVLVPTSIKSASLTKELHQLVINELGKPLAPKEIIFVEDLPKTRNAKVMRRMIRAAYLGLDPGDTSSLVNPEAVLAIQRYK